LEVFVKLYSGSKKLRSTCSGNIRPIRRSLPLIGWEQSSPVDEEKIEVKMDDGVARLFTRFGGNLFICWLVGGAVLSRRPRLRVSWITLWGMMKVYWHDFSLHFRSCCLLRVCSKFGQKLVSHYEPVENEVSLDCPNHFRRTKNSIKKRIIVRRTVLNMFVEQTFAQLRTGFRLVSRGTSVRFCFGTPFSSKVVVCGRCLVTLSLTITKRWNGPHRCPS